MKRRDFLKITMGTMGSAMGISAVQANRKPLPIAIDMAINSPTHGTASEFKGIDEGMLQEITNIGHMMDRMNIPTGDRYVCNANTGEIVYFKNLINPKTMKALSVKRTKNGWETYHG